MSPEKKPEMEETVAMQDAGNGTSGQTGNQTDSNIDAGMAGGGQGEKSPKPTKGAPIGVTILVLALILALPIALAVAARGSGSPAEDSPKGAATDGKKAKKTDVAEDGDADATDVVAEQPADTSAEVSQQEAEVLPAFHPIAASLEDTTHACAVYGWGDLLDIAAGDHFTVGVKSDGTVVTTMDDETLKRHHYEEVPSWTNIRSVAVGMTTMLGLRQDGTVVAVGDGYAGACDVSDWTDIQEIRTNGFSVGLRKDGTVVTAGHHERTRREGDESIREDVRLDTSGWRDIKQVGMSTDGVVGLSSDGTVLLAKLGEETQTLDYLAGAIQIACSSGGVMGLMPDGHVRVMGVHGMKEEDPFYACGDWHDIAYIAGGPDGAFAGLMTDGTVVVSPQHEFDIPVDGLRDVTRLSVSETHLVGLCSDDGAYEAARDAQTKRDADTEEYQRRKEENPSFRSPREIAWYDEHYMNDEGLWHGWWFTYRLPDGYEVSPQVKSRGGQLAFPSDPDRIVPVGSEDNGERDDIPMILIGESWLKDRPRFPREDEETTEDGTYVSATGDTYQVLLVPGDRLKVKYVVEDGDYSAYVTFVDIDRDAQHAFLDGLSIPVPLRERGVSPQA